MIKKQNTRHINYNNAPLNELMINNRMIKKKKHKNLLTQLQRILRTSTSTLTLPWPF